MYLVLRFQKVSIILAEVSLDAESQMRGAQHGHADLSLVKGGAANLYTPTEEEQRDARAHNEKVRSDSFSKDRSSIRALADRAKDTLTGKTNAERQ